MNKIRKTTWNDYHNGDVEKRDIEAGTLITESCGRSRIRTHCPFCKSDVEIYLWHSEKRCTTCGAICAGIFAFKVMENIK